MSVEALRLCPLQDWRIHVDQMHQHRDGIKSSLKDTKVRSLTHIDNTETSVLSATSWKTLKLLLYLIL